jgi:hypothetical protein
VPTSTFVVGKALRCRFLAIGGWASTWSQRNSAILSFIDFPVNPEQVCVAQGVFWG